DPRNVQAMYLRGRAYYGLRDYGRAAQDYDQVIKLDPRFEAALASRCVARALSGEARQALSDCNLTLRRQPNNLAALDSRAYVNLKLGRFYNAIRDYEAALRIDPEIAESRYGQSMAMLKQQRGTAKTQAVAAKTCELGVAEVLAQQAP